MKQKRQLILASASPRRRELLAQVGLEFRVQVSQAEEHMTGTDPVQIVQELARQKAEAVADSCRSTGEEAPFVILGADTIVVHNNTIMGKPKDPEDAVRMLSQLSADTHQVYTGVAFVWEQEGLRKTQVFAECTDVFVYPMEREEILSYVETGDPLDKAGAYGIQGAFAAYIRKIDGDYNNVVGLPVGRVYQELKENGLL